MSITDPTDEEVAFHESGHALAAIAFTEAEIRFVDILREGGRLGFCALTQNDFDTTDYAIEMAGEMRGRLAQFIARRIMLNNARYAAAGHLAEGIFRGEFVWFRFDRPIKGGSPLEGGYETDGFSVHKALCGIAGASAPKPRHSEKLRREMHWWLFERRAVLRDCAALLLEQRKVDGEPFVNAAYASAERHGVTLSPLPMWWKMPSAR